MKLTDSELKHIVNVDWGLRFWRWFRWVLLAILALAASGGGGPTGHALTHACRLSVQTASSHVGPA